MHRALAHEPRVLLVGDPFANLASQYCDRLVMLKGGTVLTQGTPGQVITRENIRVVYGAEVLVHPHAANGLPVVHVAPRGS